ncbi:unnamed protein product, partial [Discosporangium mesarthrocarpum]
MTLHWPDISSLVHAVARHVQAPSKTHRKAGLRVLEFFQMTRDWGVTFQKLGQTRLYAYADSSHGGDEGDRHSVSGGAGIFAGSAVAWFSRTQQVVVLSSTEEEYIAMGRVCEG